MATADWYLIKNVAELDSPALVVYPSRVRENIDQAIRMAGNPARLRPHIKTHKSPAPVQLMLGAGIRQFKCATIAEAEMLALCDAPDVLLAYQPIGPKLQRFIALIVKYPKTSFSCLVDNVPAADAMSAAFEERGLVVPVYIDLNVGMNRTGIAPGPGAMQLYVNCMQLPGTRPAGLHAYDGHIRDKDYEQRRQKCDAAFAAVMALKDAIIREYPNSPEPVIIAGGSPTFSVHCNRENVVCSPGTFIYWDKGYSEACPEQPFLPAALVLTRVISLPDSTRLCLDLGHKSIAPENELSRRVFFLNAPELQFVSQSEEHLVVDAGPEHQYKPGDMLYGLAIHICPTVALYERAYTIEDGKYKDEWITQARDRKISL